MVDHLAVHPNAKGIFARGSAHLTVDGSTPEHMEALHAFAASLGLKRAWFQPHASAPHPACRRAAQGGRARPRPRAGTPTD